MSKLTRRRQPTPRLPLAPLLALGGTGCLLVFAGPAIADGPALQFNAGFMRQAPGDSADASALALRALAAQTSLAPGRYQVDVRVNLASAGKHEIAFSQASTDTGLAPCLDGPLLRELGLREHGLVEPLPADDSCVELNRIVPDARIELEPAKLRLLLSIPQASLRRDVAGSVAPERWDEGINAAFFNYQASAQQLTRAGTGTRTSQDLYLNTGLNVEGWRLRSSQSLREDPHGKRRWTRTNTYIQHDLPGTWGTLTAGETFSNGDVFRSLPFRGVQLATDMGMLPDAMQNYAPVIRGVAQTRAKLEVLQNGYPIYSTYVAPGPYVIDDLAVGGGSGELEIVLTEADGQVRRFLQPYSTLSNLLREGVWRYSLALGRYHAADDIDQPSLWQATAARGGGWSTTLYGGVLAGDYYRAATLGMARDFGAAGAVSVDAARAHTDLGEPGKVAGQSFAARYGKAFQTGTSLRFAGYRYSTEGYRDFDEAVQQRNASSRFIGNRRSRVEASAYQNLGARSSLSMTLSQDDYWRTNLQRRQYQFQFSTQYHRVGINLYASQALSGSSNSNRVIGLGITLPLDFGRASNVSFNVQDTNGRFSERASVNGGALDNHLNYQASIANDEQQRQTTSVSLGYQTPTANLGAGYTQGFDYRSVSVNASGAVLVHGDGIVVGSYLGETNALVHVPGIAGVGVENSAAARTNQDGYMLAPHLRPYRVNQVSLQTDQVGPEVEIDNGTTQAVPRRGAVVKAAFQARSVTRLILTLQHPDGRPLPFGTQVSDDQGQRLASLGQAGQALVATGPRPQTLDIRWGQKTSQHCVLQIDPATMPEDQGYRVQTLRCPTPGHHP